MHSFLDELLATSGYDPDAYKEHAIAHRERDGSRFENSPPHTAIYGSRALKDILSTVRESGHTEGDLPVVFEAISQQFQSEARGLLRRFTGIAPAVTSGWEMYNFAKQPETTGLFRFLEEQNLLRDVDMALDYGCGKGGDVLGFARANIRAFGIDADPSMVEAANTALSAERNATIVHGDIHTFISQHPEVLGIVDVISANSVLQHITNHDLPDVLGSMKKIISKRGRLVIGQRIADSDKWQDSADDILIAKGNGETCVLRAADGRPRWYRSQQAIERHLDAARFHISSSKTVQEAFRTTIPEDHYYIVAEAD